MARKIGLVLLIIFLLPATTLTVLELSSLNKNEQILAEVYGNQLDAILFSINQYSQDVGESWASQLDKLIASSNENAGSQGFMRKNPAISWFFLADSLSPTSLRIYSLTDTSKATFKEEAIEVLCNETALFKRLSTYFQADYRKIEPLHGLRAGKYTLLLFLCKSPNGHPVTCGIAIDPKIYIAEVMAPRLQEIAEEKVVIFVNQSKDQQTVYATESFDASLASQQKAMWLLPQYTVGIMLKGESLERLASRRSYTNLFLILGINILLLIAVFWVFKNVKRELQLAQKKSDFVSNVSHEIRTPLALIAMFAETLELGRVASEEKKLSYYKIISQETQRLTRIVNKILNFSQMQAGKRQYQLASVDLNILAHEVLSVYEFHLTNNGFTYQFNLTEDLPLVQADAEAATEAIINLIDNAIKYSETTKEIKLTTGIEGSYCYLEIKDKGMGISNDQQHQIFDKFYRVASGPVHNTKGTGLGLSLVKHIMEGQGGKVTVKSVLGKGSSFRLYFKKV